jgi:hypothetical protein
MLWEVSMESDAIKDKTDALISLVRQEMKAEDILNRIFGLAEEKAAEAARRRQEVEESDPTKNSHGAS